MVAVITGVLVTAALALIGVSVIFIFVMFWCLIQFIMGQDNS